MNRSEAPSPLYFLVFFRGARSANIGSTTIQGNRQRTSLPARAGSTRPSLMPVRSHTSQLRHQILYRKGGVN
jgi:hypothetical protein